MLEYQLVPSTAKRGGFTERSYTKICGDTVDEIRDWIREQLGANVALSAVCSRCKPET